MARVGPSAERGALRGPSSRGSSTACGKRWHRGALRRLASGIRGRCCWRSPPVCARGLGRGRPARRSLPGPSVRQVGWRSSVACAPRLSWAAPRASPVRPRRPHGCPMPRWGGLGPINPKMHRAASPLSPQRACWDTPPGGPSPLAACGGPYACARGRARSDRMARGGSTTLGARWRRGCGANGWRSGCRMPCSAGSRPSRWGGSSPCV